MFSLDMANATRLGCGTRQSRCLSPLTLQHLSVPHLANLFAAIRQLNDISYTKLIAQGRLESAQKKREKDIYREREKGGERSLVGSHAQNRLLDRLLDLPLLLPLSCCAFL